MDAIVIDLKDFGLRTPEQVLRVFFSLYSRDSVKFLLWEVYRVYAVNDEKGIAALTGHELRIMLLFDHLIDLVGAVECLRENGSTERCVICGREHEGNRDGPIGA